MTGSVMPPSQSPWNVHRASVTAIHDEAPGVRTYNVTLADKRLRNCYSFAPGQFNMLYVPGVGEAAISISSDPDKPQVLQHTVRAVGNVTNSLAQAQIGDELPFRGPYGAAWPVEDCQGKDLVIAAGGIGLAPLRPVIHYIINRRHAFGRVWVLYGSRTPSDLIYQDQFDGWRAHGIEVLTIVDRADDNWKGPIGVVPDLLRQVTVSQPATLFTCGPEIMMRFVILGALNMGWQEHQVFLSLERNMNCALGFCGHCQFGPEFICKSGPVFNYRRIEPYLRLEDL